MKLHQLGESGLRIVGSLAQLEEVDSQGAVNAQVLEVLLLCAPSSQGLRMRDKVKEEDNNKNKDKDKGKEKEGCFPEEASSKDASAEGCSLEGGFSEESLLDLLASERVYAHVRIRGLVGTGNYQKLLDMQQLLHDWIGESPNVPADCNLLFYVKEGI